MKKITSVSLDAEILKKAQESQVNISAIVNDALKHKMKKSLFNAICSKCHVETNDVFLCLERELVLCCECQEGFDMSRCPHDEVDEHMHIRVPGYSNQNERFIPEVERISSSNKIQPQPSNA